LFTIEVAVIAFASLIVKTNNPNTIDNIHGAVLIPMVGGRHSFGDFPNHHFEHSTITVMSLKRVMGSAGMLTIVSTVSPVVNIANNQY
jgi:hypothetical protein